MQKWLKKLRIKANKYKSVHVTFTTWKKTCSPVHINNVHLPQQDDVKYSGCISMGNLPGANTYSQNESNWKWRSTKCIGCLDRSQNSPQATKFSYKAILKPVWTHGVQLWGMTSSSNRNPRTLLI
jgi:hypothetical protein